MSIYPVVFSQLLLMKASLFNCGTASGVCLDTWRTTWWQRYGHPRARKSCSTTSRWTGREVASKPLPAIAQSWHSICFLICQIKNWQDWVYWIVHLWPWEFYVGMQNEEIPWSRSHIYSTIFKFVSFSILQFSLLS